LQRLESENRQLASAWENTMVQTGDHEEIDGADRTRGRERDTIVS
jgi:hypothetical protein